MSNVHHIHKANIIDDEEKCLDEASNWIAKIDRGLTKEETQALKSWIAVSVKNAEVLMEVAQVWDKMEELSRLSDLFPQTLVKKKPLSRWVGAIAASVVFAITIGFYQSGSFSIFDATQKSTVVVQQMSYQTDIGESNTIQLPDSSQIVLNTNSFVQVKYTPSARVIELQRGEIHIDVAHDKSRPLSVVAGGKIIQAVGTAFNVEVRNEFVELIVTDGRVLVAHGIKQYATLDDDVGSGSLIKRLPSNSLAISKGEKVDLDLTGKVVEKVIKVAPLELAASLSWRQGNLIFRGESLADAMAEISRYTDINFEIDDNEMLSNVQVAGLFKTGDVKGLLEVLSNNFNIGYEKISDDKIFLKYKG